MANRPRDPTPAHRLQRAPRLRRFAAGPAANDDASPPPQQPEKFDAKRV